MKPYVADVYRCPLTGGVLELQVLEEMHLDLSPEERAMAELGGERPDDVGREVRTGLLVNREHGYWYPVVSHIPVLLDFDNPAYDHLEQSHPRASAMLKGLRRPGREPRPGEALTQRTFTRQWHELEEEDVLSFTWTAEQRRQYIAMELGLEGEQLKPDFTTLTVGCGSGRESEHLAAVTGRRVFGVDLNFSLLRSGPGLARHPLVHNSIASVFALPFSERSFDFVYSHGVLMVTYNTKRAWESLESRRAPGGRAYIWVYALEDAQRGKRTRRLVYAIEERARPRIAGLPNRLQAIVIEGLARGHFFRYKRGGLLRDVWELRHSRHSMRDRWTPRYAHRHSFHEVISWFVEKGLDYELIDPIEFRRTFNRNLFGIGIRGLPRQPLRRTLGGAADDRSTNATSGGDR